MWWYLFSFSWLEMCVPSDMITGLFSFSCTLCVVSACLSVSCLAQEALPTAVPKLIVLHRSEEGPGTFLGELASFNLSCTAVNYQGSWPAQRPRCWLAVGGEGGVRVGCGTWGKGSWLSAHQTRVCARSSACQIPPSEKELWKMLRRSLLTLISLGLCPGVKCYVVLD